MVLEVDRQERYSRLKLLLRFFFGWFYILLPHGIFLFIFSVGGVILHFLAFWLILFTGRYPESWFQYQIYLYKYYLRVFLTLANFRDDYPAFGLLTEVPYLKFEVPYPERINRFLLLVKFFFGWFYVWLPHSFCLFLRNAVGTFLYFLSWYWILLTGKFPAFAFAFLVGTIRWSTRLYLYLANLSEEYPPFRAK